MNTVWRAASRLSRQTLRLVGIAGETLLRDGARRVKVSGGHWGKCILRTNCCGENSESMKSTW